MKFHECTAPVLSSLDRDQTLVVIPIAAVEQHGPHLPTGTDKILCTAVAEALEQRACDRLLLLPTVWLGASAHHLRLGATLNAALDTYISTLCDIARSVLNDGYRRLLFLNGHGGNIDPMRIAVRELQLEFPESLLVAGSYWTVAADTTAQTLQGEDKEVGHACEFETSLMLHLRPDLVAADQRSPAAPPAPGAVDGLFISRDMRQRTADGYTGRPDLASSETGSQLFDCIVRGNLLAVDKLLAQPLGLEYAELSDTD